MRDEIEALAKAALDALARAATAAEVEAVRQGCLGRKGTLQGVLRAIGRLPPDQRGPVGQAANAARAAVEAAAEARREALRGAQEAALAETEWVDATLPAPPEPRPRAAGTLHPVTTLARQVEDTFLRMGFEVLDGPWAEDEWHNFTALNIPPDHPARDLQDTFWLADGSLLRTHTSPVQVRLMENRPPPIRAVCIGRVFRQEEVDATHENTFHQVEGFYVDREVSVAHMLFVLRTLLAEILQQEVEVRLRPSYFPFVEPGFELDVTFRGRWLELLGCGLVHPDVLRAGGVDPGEWSGFAFGMGIDRLVMLRHGIEDIRHLMGGDLRFLRQFASGVEG